MHHAFLELLDEAVELEMRLLSTSREVGACVCVYVCVLVRFYACVC